MDKKIWRKKYLSRLFIKKSKNMQNSLFREILKEVLIEIFEEGKPKSGRTKSGKKVPGKYLTKNKAAMKKEIERVSKLKSTDPSAYKKWEADYADKDKTKKYKTKKGKGTIAFEKMFGKKKK